MRLFEVGGCVRDELLGIPSKDIDFTVVLEDEFADDGYNRQGNTPFEAMTLGLRRMGFEIFLETPEYLTVRARFPKTEWHTGALKGLTADFVLARKESDYTDGRRPDVVEPGTLEDDLRRRDFTMNAIAKDATGALIDPFNGIKDIENKVIKAVGSAEERFMEDALRAVRALRFSVTKGFDIDPKVEWAMELEAVLHLIRTKISDERIKDELNKMFRFSTIDSLRALEHYPLLRDALFDGRVNMEATMKQRGRNG